MKHAIALKMHNNTKATLLQKALICVTILCISSPASRINAESTRFSVYCTGNFDSTGECLQEGGAELECIIVPGSVIACQDKSASIYECVQYGAIQNNQSQFICEPDSDNSINSNLFKKTRAQTNGNGFPQRQNKKTNPNQTDFNSTDNSGEFINAF